MLLEYYKKNQIIKSNDHGLTNKQKLFCEEFVKTGNKTQSYLKAYGGNYRNANVSVIKLLVKTSIKKYISKLKTIARKNDNSIMEVTEALKLLSQHARGKTQEEVIQTVGIGDGYSEIVKTKKQISNKDQITALKEVTKRDIDIKNLQYKMYVDDKKYKLEEKKLEQGQKNININHNTENTEKENYKDWIQNLSDEKIKVLFENIDNMDKEEITKLLQEK